MNTISQAEFEQLDHKKLLVRAIELGKMAREHGNHPFGALLADLDGNILLEAENTAFSDNDFTRHAETNLLSEASRTYSTDELANMVMYTNAESCVMCAGTVFFTGVRNVVYGLSADRLAELWISEGNKKPIVLDMSCRQVFEASPYYRTNVIGPMMEEEASVAQMGYKNPQA